MGETGDDVLTERYRGKFPEGFRIRITNPSGIIIMGRDNNSLQLSCRILKL
jgi:hypothetical protein